MTRPELDERRSTEPDAGPAGVHSDSLRARYARYRETQGRELLALLPREGLRGLLRALRAEGADLDDQDDALARLAGRCADLLPLPPFETWSLDFHRNRTAYAHLPGPPMAPEAPDGAPVTVDVRHLAVQDASWVASLEMRREGGLWVGFIRFNREGGVGDIRTADVFRERSPLEVRERFFGFDDGTLRAFLRSALP